MRIDSGLSFTAFEADLSAPLLGDDLVSAAENVMPRPGTKVVRIAANGEPSIEAFRCGACGAVTPILTMACRKCGSRTAPEPYRSAETGALYTWSVVHRSYPGIAVPFISAIVDLDGGLSIKGTVQGVVPGDLKSGLRLRLVYDDAGGAKTDEGAPYIGFHFVPEGAAA